MTVAICPNCGTEIFEEEREDCITCHAQSIEDAVHSGDPIAELEYFDMFLEENNG